jgi:hypothetical protein
MRLQSRLPFLRRFLTGSILLYAAVVLALGGTAAASPALVAALTVWSALLAAAARYRLAMQRGRWLDLVATNVALTLLLAEAALRALAACAGTPLLVRADLDAHRLQPGHDYGAGLVGNRLGYPGAELPSARTPGVQRIVALGDSFAVGPAVPFADNYLTRLAAETGAEVGNFGVSGAGPREYLAVLERDGWRVQPDLVLVSVFVGNDITEPLPGPRRLDPRRHALYLFAHRAWRLLRENWRADGAPAGPDRLTRPALTPTTFREVEARRLAVCLKRSSSGLDKQWQQALRDLEGIITACRQRGVRVAVVLIPDEFQVNPTVLDDALRTAGRSREEVDLELPQRRLAEFCRLRGVPCLDLLPAFRATADTYAPRDTHWNVRGNHLAAQEIARWLPQTSGAA